MENNGIHFLTKTWLNWNILYIGEPCLFESRVISYSFVVSYFSIVGSLSLRTLRTRSALWKYFAQKPRYVSPNILSHRGNNACAVPTVWLLSIYSRKLVAKYTVSLLARKKYLNMGYFNSDIGVEAHFQTSQ